MDYLNYYDVDYNSLKSTGTIKTLDQYTNIMFCAELSFLILVPIILLFISHRLYQIVKELKNARKSSDIHAEGASSQN